MAIKVTELTEASTVSDNDLLMIVQEGANKKVSCDKFVKTGDSVPDAQALDGHPAEDFLLADDTASDSEKLGGFPASDYAKKTDIPNLTDPTWCRWIPWFKNIEAPSVVSDPLDKASASLRALNYVVCDGRFLDRETYQELFDIIGLDWTSTEDAQANPTMFRIPNLRGRFILGANATGPNSVGVSNGEIKTENLPYGVYSGADFDENGQFVFPKLAGKTGGDPTTYMTDTRQMVQHTHTYQAYRQTSGSHPWLDCDVSSNAGNLNMPRLYSPCPTNDSGTNGVNSDGCFSSYPIFGNYNANTNWARGMLAMPPYVVCVYIMKIKP